ncbi:MAG: YaaA family protein [Coprobacillaceae bacterium]
MKIIIAPAKQMKYTVPINKETNPVYLSKQKKLHTILKKYDASKLHDVMKISFKMANEVYNYFHQKEDSHPALHYYSGTVFKQLKLTSYKQEEQDYISSYLRILSAYYGVLSPYDLIQRYRLDMKMKIDDINLYSYWAADVKKYFKEEDFIISLASKEFTNMIKHPHIITIDFVEDKGDKLVRNAMYVKQARGKMLHYLIKEKITNIEELKKISFDNYHYHDSLSTKNNLVFYRTPDCSY